MPSTPSIHKYEKNYLELLSRQPGELTDLEKHIRIDKLSCLDAKLECATKLVSCRWFIALSILINGFYLDWEPRLAISDEFTAVSFKQLLLLTDGEVESKDLMPYILDRMKLINYLEKNYEREGQTGKGAGG